MSVFSSSNSGIPVIRRLCRLVYCSKSSVRRLASIMFFFRSLLLFCSGLRISEIWFCSDGSRWANNLSLICCTSRRAETKRFSVSSFDNAPTTASKMSSRSSEVSDVSLDRARLRCSVFFAVFVVFDFWIYSACLFYIYILCADDVITR